MNFLPQFAQISADFSQRTFICGNLRDLREKKYGTAGGY